MVHYFLDKTGSDSSFPLTIVSLPYEALITVRVSISASLLDSFCSQGMGHHKLELTESRLYLGSQVDYRFIKSVCHLLFCEYYMSPKLDCISLQGRNYFLYLTIDSTLGPTVPTDICSIAICRKLCCRWHRHIEQVLKNCYDYR